MASSTWPWGLRAKKCSSDSLRRRASSLMLPRPMTHSPPSLANFLVVAPRRSLASLYPRKARQCRSSAKKIRKLRQKNLKILKPNNQRQQAWSNQHYQRLLLFLYEKIWYFLLSTFKQKFFFYTLLISIEN